MPPTDVNQALNFGGDGGWGWGGGGRQGRCEQRSKVFAKIFFFFWGGGGRVGGRGEVRVDVNGEVKFFAKIQNNFFFFLGGGVRSGGGGGGWGSGRVGGGGQGGCERRIEVFCENSKTKIVFLGGSGLGWWGGGGGGVRVDVSGEVEFLCKFK